MSVYKRGNVWWYKFKFQGQVIRDSAKTSSKTLAREAERARRHNLETAVNRITKRQKMPLFSVAAKDWIESHTGLAENTTRAYRHYVKTLVEQFGSRPGLRHRRQ